MKKYPIIGFYTLLRREIVRILRIWPQTLLPPVITMSLYFAIFGSLIGSRIGEIDGIDYINFIAPGLIMMAIITNSYANVSSSFFNAKFQRSIEELYVSTMSCNSIIFGYILGGVARGILVAAGVIIVSLLFTKLTVSSIWLVITIAILTATLFSLAGLLNGIFAKKFDDVTITPTFVLTPLTYLGGVFYSIKLISPIWQKISFLNPVLYMVNSFRYSMLGITDVNIELAIFIICLFIVLSYSLCFYLLRSGIGIKS